MAPSPTGRPRLVNRIGAFHRKTADGCKTCRIRRIKCDKGIPACSKCSTTGRTCDGYSSSPSGVESSSRSLTTLIAASSSPFHLPISTNILEDDQERRSFSFFCRHTFPQLSGPFDSSDFWQRLLQATHREPAIRHAAVALGALHERFEILPHTNLNFTLSKGEDDDVFAMQQYAKAIKALLGFNGGQEKAANVALVTCVLFVYFETLRGHHATAISHINGGIKILSAFHQSASSSSPYPSTISQSNTPYVSTPTLTLIFAHFDSQASALLAGRERALQDPSSDNPLPGYAPEIPEEFQSLGEAMNSLDYIRTESFRSMATVDRSDWVAIRVMLACMQSTATIRLNLWGQAFHSFVGTQERKLGGGLNGEGKEEKEWRDAVNVLRVHKIFMGFYFCVDLERALRDEGLWDEHTEDFEEIVRLSEDIIGPHEGSAEHGGGVKRLLCHDTGNVTGIVLPLNFVATKCRVRSIRWKAIELMRRTERQEGLWNSVLTALAAEQLVRLEEEWLVEEKVPRERRIRCAEVGFDLQERRARLRYGRLEVGVFAHPPPREMEWIEGSICW